MDSPVTPGRVFRFGQFEARPEAGQLFKQGRKVSLQEQPFRLLVVLLERPNSLVSRQELKEALWPRGMVEFDKSLDVAMAKLRQALGDDSSSPLFIATVPRRGYQFIAPLSVEEPAPAASPAVDRALARAQTSASVSTDAAVKSRRRRTAAGLAAAAVIATVAVATWQWRNREVAPQLAARALVLIGDFSNSTGDPSFDHALRTSAVIEFEQSPYLTVLSDDRVGAALQALGRPPDDLLEPAIARQVCQQQRAAVAINGSIQRQDQGFLLSLIASRCSDAGILAKVGYSSDSKEQVVPTLGRAIAQLRKTFGESSESLRQYDVTVAAGTTNSLEALKAYQLGMDLRSHTRNIDAIPAFKTAIALDPTFAIAYAQLGSCYSNLQEEELASKYFTQAFERREHATEPERLYISGRYFEVVTAEMEKGAGIYKEWTEIYPNDWRGHNAMSNDANMLGRYTLAASAANRAIELQPDHNYGYTNRAVALLSLNRLDEADQVAREAMRRGRDGGVLHSVLFYTAYLRDDEAGMARQRVWAAAHPDEIDIPLADAEAAEAEGRIKDSEKQFNQLAEWAAAHGLAGYAQILLAQKALFDVEMGLAKSSLNNLRAAAKLGSNEFSLELSALAYARLGDSGKAKQLQNELDRRYPLSTFNISVFAPTIRTALSIPEAPSSADILAIMKPAIGYEMGRQAVLIPTYVRAVALLSVKAGNDAEGEFRKVIDNRPVDAATPLYTLAYLGLARSLALQQRLPDSREAYEKVVGLWKAADADLPVMLKAKRELELLSAH
ncbi:MAG TPA: winged helix-turn-helix domain-containing protein [Steroidobacteraceae bacterium]|jgi:DNA-binding winged helix-turn-helix (wHTH) protein/Flp pilus assembly protein TadD